MPGEVLRQALTQDLLVVGEVVVRDLIEAVVAEGGDHRVGVGAAHLVLGNGQPRLDEFIAGRDDHQGRLARDAHAGQSRGGRDRDLRLHRAALPL